MNNIYSKDGFNLIEQGEPNEFVIITDDKKWVVGLKFNGEIKDYKQHQTSILLTDAIASQNFKQYE